MTENPNKFIITKINGMETLAETKTLHYLPIRSMKAMCILLNYALREGDIPDCVEQYGFEKDEDLQEYVRYDDEE